MEEELAIPSSHCAGALHILCLSCYSLDATYWLLGFTENSVFFPDVLVGVSIVGKRHYGVTETL